MEYKVKARSQVGWLVRSGQWPKASAYKCECGCGKQASEYHHPFYDQPYRVVALNRECHMRIHGGKFS